jgi:hypothetical protein
MAMQSTGSRVELPRTWVVPRLEFKGTIGQIVQSGGGKLSIQLADPGEMRCEKPHAETCSPL